MTSARRWDGPQELDGLRRLAVALTVLNVLGYTLLGFEQALVVPVVAVLAAYATELALEWIAAARHGRRAQFFGGPWTLADFLLQAHITGLAVGMLLYTNDRLAAVAGASVLAITATRVLRVPLEGRTSHLFHPANLGITAILLAFPWLGIAPPRQFTETLAVTGAWLLPAIIVATGTLLTARFAHRLPLIAACLSGFFVVALFGSIGSSPLGEFLRSSTAPASAVPFLMYLRAAVAAAGITTPEGIIASSLMPMTSVAFLLYTFYIVADPTTTPAAPRHQVAFGLSVAAVAGMLTAFQVGFVFALFFSLTIVSAGRGLALVVAERSRRRQPAMPAFTPVPVRPMRDSIGRVGMPSQPPALREMGQEEPRVQPEIQGHPPRGAQEGVRAAGARV